MSTISKIGSAVRHNNKSTIDKQLSSKISTINKYLETKVSKIGNQMSGNLNMNNNCIVNVKDPEADGDAVSRGYCFDFVNHLIKTSQVQSEIRNNPLDMGGYGISGVNFPDSGFDAINKKYLQIAYLNNSSNIKTKKLMSICQLINDLLAKYSNDFTSAFDRQFRLKYTWMQNMILTYNRLYRKPELDTVLDLHPAIESILFPYIKDIFCLIIAIIEELPKNIFTELKQYLVHNKISFTPDEGTDHMKIRRFIQKFANDIDPNRENEIFELLLQKNLMFVDLGIKYVSDSLLAQFVI